MGNSKDLGQCRKEGAKRRGRTTMQENFDRRLADMKAVKKEAQGEAEKLRLENRAMAAELKRLRKPSRLRRVLRWFFGRRS